MSINKLGPKPMRQGSQGRSAVKDLNVQLLLSEILMELQILNKHMTMLTDVELTKTDMIGENK